MQNKNARTQRGRLEAQKQELERQLKILQQSNDRLKERAEALDGPLNLMADLLWARLEDRVREELKDLVDEAMDRIHVEVTT